MQKISIGKTLLITLLLTFSCFPMFYTVKAVGTVNSNWTSSPPTIDGIFGATEWTDAYFQSIRVWENSSHPPSQYVDLQLWIMNDANNIYFRAIWLDGTRDSVNDVLTIAFDEDGDGSFASISGKLDNVISVISNTNTNSTFDGYGNDPAAAIQDVFDVDLVSNYTYSDNYYKYEISVPLNTAEEEDLQSKAGDLIGIAFIIDLGEGAGGEILYGYPDDTYQMSNYSTVTFQLAGESIGTTLNIVILIGTISIIAMVIYFRGKSSEHNLKLAF